jgi:predicted P-loop ATPase
MADNLPAPDKFQWLFEIADATEVFEHHAISAMAQLRSIDPARFERLLGALKTLKFPAPRGVERVIAAVNKLEKEQRRAKKRQIASPDASLDDVADEDGFVRDEFGSIMKKPHNIRSALRLMGIHLRYDVFADRVVAINEVGDEVAAGDAFVNDTWIRLDDEFGFLPDKNTLWRSTLFETARRDPFHPVLDRLRSIEWDGKNRVDGWLVDYAHVEDTPFNRAVGTIVLKAAVQRLLTPGCKFDETMLLQGAQGLGKSTMIKIMALEEDWFTDSMPIQESEQRIIEATRGKWIVEIPEMQGRDRASVDATKAQLSRTHDRARLAYATVVEEVPRMFIMVTTGNDGKMLVDLTGNRRFWPVRITKKVDLARLAQDMEQLWAEAMLLLEQDPSIGLPEELWADAVRLQDDMTIDNPFEDKLNYVFKDAKGVLASVDVWEILGVNGSQQRSYSQMMGKAMEKLGWAPKVRTINGARNTRCYVRPADGSCDVHLQIKRSGLDGRVTGVEPIIAHEDFRDLGVDEGE